MQPALLHQDCSCCIKLFILSNWRACRAVVFYCILPAQSLKIASTTTGREANCCRHSVSQRHSINHEHVFCITKHQHHTSLDIRHHQSNHVQRLIQSRSESYPSVIFDICNRSSSLNLWDSYCIFKAHTIFSHKTCVCCRRKYVRAFVWLQQGPPSAAVNVEFKLHKAWHTKDPQASALFWWLYTWSQTRRLLGARRTVCALQIEAWIPHHQHRTAWQRDRGFRCWNAGMQFQACLRSSIMLKNNLGNFPIAAALWLESLKDNAEHQIWRQEHGKKRSLAKTVMRAGVCWLSHSTNALIFWISKWYFGEVHSTILRNVLLR